LIVEVSRRPQLPHGTYLVAGLGSAGGAAVGALLECGSAERLLAWDRARSGQLRGLQARLRRRGVDVQLGDDGLASLAEAGPGAILVKSPGMDFDTPLLEAARAAGHCVIDELELGWRLSRGPIVGVTGTNGKSTTSKLIAAVLGAAGASTQLVGNTEFGPPLSAAAAKDWTVCEVSSFQLEAAPSFLPEIAVFTNLTPEHLTRHLSMEAYGGAKRGMFIRGERTTPCAVLNVDDPFGRRLAQEVAQAGGRALGYGFAPEADIRIEGAHWDMRRARLRLRTPTGASEYETPLPGAHNARNVAAAVAVGHALGLPAAATARALVQESAPAGRWELMGESRPFDVLVDYAHTPDGIRQVLETIRQAIEDREGARIRTVFGAVGLRDEQKARESAVLARSLSDQLILTTGSAPGDPRLVRLQELRRAALQEGPVEMAIERRAAIARAIAAARPGDVVAVLGLGALTRQTVDAAGTRLPNDDRQTVRELLERVGEPSWR
jgi:UDP-N-acetylmuramoyl-L-alanyl-D-glutamate--2,6-diaminopimelate ligase